MTQQHEPHLAVSAPSEALRSAGPATAEQVDQPAEPPADRQVLRRSLIGLDHASVMGVELMSAILVWAGLGYLLDRWLGTGPWFLIIGGLVGNAAGVYLIWLRSARMDEVERQAAADRRRVGAGRGRRAW